MILEVRRTDGRYDAFSVPERPWMSLVDALEYIQFNLDSTLLFRHSCHHGSCGTCGLLVNGERLLACTTLVASLGEGPHRIDPLRVMDPIGDVAVDPTPLFDDIPPGLTYTRPGDTNRDATLPQEVEGWQRFEDCIECGLCESGCPVVAKSAFRGPAALAAIHREIEKDPDRTDELLVEATRADGAALCERRIICSAVCPQGVAPARRIAQIVRLADARSAE